MFQLLLLFFSFSRQGGSRLFKGKRRIKGRGLTTTSNKEKTTLLFPSLRHNDEIGQELYFVLNFLKGFFSFLIYLFPIIFLQKNRKYLSFKI